MKRALLALVALCVLPVAALASSQPVPDASPPAAEAFTIATLTAYETASMPTETAIEQEIAAKGLTAPRVTPEMVDAAILAEQYHVFPGTMLTVCVLTLQNGFTVTGESACASPENFNAELGQKIARGKAREKIWPLLGYALRDRLASAAAVAT